MAYQFEFRKEKIVIDFRFFLFKEFVDIWTKDKSKNKLKANKMLYFIFLLCDIGKENPLKDVNVSKRETEAKFRAYRNKDKEFVKNELDLLEPAIKVYVDINKTMEERLLIAFDEKAIQLSNKLDTTLPETIANEENGVVSFVSNSKIITDALSKLSKIRTNREKIVSAIKKKAISQKVRGGIKLSPLVMGLLKLEEDVEVI